MLEIAKSPNICKSERGKVVRRPETPENSEQSIRVTTPFKASAQQRPLASWHPHLLPSSMATNAQNIPLQASFFLNLLSSRK